MTFRFSTALILLIVTSLLFVGNANAKEDEAGLQARHSYLSQTYRIDYSVVFTTPPQLATPPSVTPVPPTATSLPSPTPVSPSPKPVAGESASRPNSSIFLVFVVIIFGGIVLATVVSTLKIGRRRR
ncbi:MAG: hypothetical protein WCS37_03370 [Chloroflexota bacterium]|nr:hypothetical protein [Chloroflexota bacterium]